MDQNRLKERDLSEVEEDELAIMLNVGALLRACVFCGTEWGPEDLGILEIFVAETRGWVCHECGHERAPLLARLLDLAQVAEDFAFEVQGGVPPGEEPDDGGPDSGSVH